MRQAAVPSLAEEDWGVRRDSLPMLAKCDRYIHLGTYRDTSPRGHDLEPNTQPRATTKVIPRSVSPADEDLDKLNWRAALAILRDRGNLHILAVDLLLAGLVAAEPSQQVARFLVATDRCIVARTVGEHLDERHQYDSRDALEREKKAPSDVGVAVVDEGEAKGQPVRDRNSEV